MYKYTQNSLFDNPINYSYSTYEGEHFIKEWEINRLSYSDRISQNITKTTHPKLPNILLVNSNRFSQSEGKDSCDLLLHKYESSKKIYGQYINNIPTKSSGYKNIENYISSALLIESFYSKTKDLRYLNCLLKLCDLFQSDKKFLVYSSFIKDLIYKEIKHISDLLSQRTTHDLNKYNGQNEKLKIYTKPKKIKGLILICCNSSRSSIYLQSLINANIYPEYIIYMCKDKAKNEVISYEYEKLNYPPEWLFLPKEYIHPKALSRKYNINLIEIETTSINSDLIYEKLKIIKVKLIIYCGFGGEIVSQELLDQFSFIHCHAGTLPEFRGSTTFYYEILSKRFPSVSCILLDKTIDTGPILSIKSFPIPFKKDNIDLLYEPSIRANLLCDVLLNCGISLNLKAKVQANKGKNLNYYIIHPILKHVCFSFFRDF